MGLHRFDGVHLSVASLNLGGKGLQFGHQLHDLKTQHNSAYNWPIRCLESSLHNSEKEGHCTWPLRTSRARCCSSITSLISLRVLRPNASSDCCNCPTHIHTWSEQQAEITELNTAPGKRQQCYHRLNVSHLAAAWWWCHKGWCMCPALWPLLRVSALWQEHQSSPRWLDLTG